ncbi:hypothetical protein QVD17_09909 [Tagetes erecta]|uniref:Uncharacterized protein n=1 Tax=Tagetes erecta TaxID=13708 RepID=A0AAD8NZ06_TARER|nr:hypothetical protein QVD17_09909 [Tagetes erecta]
MTMNTQNTLNANAWVEADKLFLKNVMIVDSMKDIEEHMVLPYNADSIRARQLYLRSYTFSRLEKKKTVTQKTKSFLRKEKNYLHMKFAMLGSLFLSLKH